MFEAYLILGVDVKLLTRQEMNQNVFWNIHELFFADYKNEVVADKVEGSRLE